MDLAICRESRNGTLADAESLLYSFPPTQVCNTFFIYALSAPLFRIQQKRVFDTVKVANGVRHSASCPATLPIPGSNRSSVVMTTKPFHSGLQLVEGRSPLSQRTSSENISRYEMRVIIMSDNMN